MRKIVEIMDERVDLLSPRTPEQEELVEELLSLGRESGVRSTFVTFDPPLFVPVERNGFTEEFDRWLASRKRLVPDGFGATPRERCDR